jgi:3-oxoacyl-[acyl-carrier protein] reductase
MTTALVTGASRGIGRATAIELAERGVELILLGRASSAMTETGALLTRNGAVLHTIAVDLEDTKGTVAACQRIVTQFGAPDIVVNNAAIVDRQAVEHLSIASWERQLAVNLRAPFLITRELLPSLRAKRQGRIIHVASISATLGAKDASAYCASKWGLVGFMKSLAEELKDSGLMTLAILPGSVETDMLKGSGFEPRMQAEDVAKTIAHYALDAPLAHNGSVIEMFGV